MLDIGKVNLFLNENNYVVSKLIDYYDLMGHNCLFLDGVNSNILVKCSKLDIKFTRNNNISEILPNFLFRVDLLLTVVPDGNIKYLLSSIREVTDLPIIFIIDSNYYNEKDFDYVYRLYKEDTQSLDLKNYQEQFLNLSRINDIKNDWDMSLADLKTQYIRDKKINDLLK
jgi:hypothetical protein